MARRGRQRRGEAVSYCDADVPPALLEVLSPTDAQDLACDLNYQGLYVKQTGPVIDVCRDALAGPICAPLDAIASGDLGIGISARSRDLIQEFYATQDQSPPHNAASCLINFQGDDPRASPSPRFSGDCIQEVVEQQFGATLYSALRLTSGEVVTYGDAVRYIFSHRTIPNLLENQDLPTTHRHIWYSDIKNWMQGFRSYLESHPIRRLDGQLVSTNPLIPQKRTLEDSVSKYLNEIIDSDPTISFASLNIADASRPRSVKGQPLPTDAVELEGSRWPIVFIEKLEYFEMLNAALDPEVFIYLAGKGFASRAATADLANRIQPGDEVVIYSFTDYDPHGMNIARTFASAFAKSVPPSVTLVHRYINWGERPELEATMVANQYEVASNPPRTLGKRTPWWEPVTFKGVPPAVGLPRNPTRGVEQDQIAPQDMINIITEALQADDFTPSVIAAGKIRNYLSKSHNTDTLYLLDYAASHPEAWLEEVEAQTRLDELYAKRLQSSNALASQEDDAVKAARVKALTRQIIASPEITEEIAAAEERWQRGQLFVTIDIEGNIRPLATAIARERVGGDAEEPFLPD